MYARRCSVTREGSACMHVRIYVCMCGDHRGLAYVRTYMHAYIHTYMSTHIRTCTHPCVHTYMHVHVRTCMQVRSEGSRHYIHACMRTYVHACRCAQRARVTTRGWACPSVPRAQRGMHACMHTMHCMHEAGLIHQSLGPSAVCIACMHTMHCMCMEAYPWKQACMHGGKHACTHTYIHTDIHTHMHTHMHGAGGDQHGG